MSDTRMGLASPVKWRVPGVPPPRSVKNLNGSSREWSLHQSRIVDRIDELLASLDLSADLIAYFARHRSLDLAWRECTRADWLMELALAAEVDRALIVLAASDCVALGLESARLRCDATTQCVDVARAWAAGSSTSAECWAAAFGISQLTFFDDASRAAARAAACVAFAGDTGADGAYYAARGHALEAISLTSEACNGDHGDELASFVRGRISWAMIEEGLRAHERTSFASGAFEIAATAPDDGSSRNYFGSR